uniref:Uncharacterized protein n=1 Tax=Timema douglasi TaxID=61478 RepID=A0A7R8ZIM4_TIMDO|nr:unnamed protein product [Timema douglasi]
MDDAAEELADLGGDTSRIRGVPHVRREILAGRNLFESGG